MRIPVNACLQVMGALGGSAVVCGGSTQVTIIAAPAGFYGQQPQQQGYVPPGQPQYPGGAGFSTPPQQYPISGSGGGGGYYYPPPPHWQQQQQPQQPGQGYSGRDDLSAPLVPQGNPPDAASGSINAQAP